MKVDSPRRRAVALAAAYAVLVLAGAWVGHALLLNTDRGLAEDRVVYQAFQHARAAARLAEAGQGQVTPHLIEYGNTAGEKNPSLLRHVLIDMGTVDEFGVLGGSKVVWSMHGETGPIGPLDRPLADRANHLASRFRGAEADRQIQLYELIEITDAEAGHLRVAAFAPVVVDDTMVGLSGALMRVAQPEVHTTWALWLIALGLIAVGIAIFIGLPSRPRLAAIAAALAFAAVTLVWLPQALTERTNEHFRQRASDMLEVQGQADTHEAVALVSPVPGRIPWSSDGALRLERAPGNSAPQTLGGSTTRVGGATASVHLHSAFVDVTAGAFRVDFAIWALLIGLLLFVSVGPLSRLLAGVYEQPGTYGYTAPAIIGLLVLVIFPFATGIGLSFYRYHLEGNAYEFIGLHNFMEIMAPSASSDINFWWTFGVTVLWTASNVLLHVSIGLGLAMVLNLPGIRFKKLYRTLLILPWAVPNYITALMWRSMFIGENGPVNSVLGTFGVGPITWFDDNFWTNFVPNLVANTWLGFPFMMVVSLGALQSIPTGLYEAAQLDGATRWQQFRNVTLPLLKPALFPAIILGVIWTFNMFNIIYLVSGGAGGTEILITEAYKAFHAEHRHGYAAAYSVLIFLILLSYTVITNRVTKATEGALG